MMQFLNIEIGGLTSVNVNYLQMEAGVQSVVKKTLAHSEVVGLLCVCVWLLCRSYFIELLMSLGPVTNSIAADMAHKCCAFFTWGLGCCSEDGVNEAGRWLSHS